jgi:hypothetical protein
MQVARQGRRSRTSQRSTRSKTIAAIQITWKKVRRDLSDVDESREQRLTFIAGVLNLKGPIASTRDLTDKQLGRVLDRLRELERQPELPETESIHAPANRSVDAGAGAAEIVHLATASQVATIEKLFHFLGWRLQTQEGFLEERFKRKSPRLLTPKQAGSLTMILLNIGAAKSIRYRAEVGRVSRTMIRAEIPSLKRRLEIDHKTAVSKLENEYEIEVGE